MSLVSKGEVINDRTRYLLQIMITSLTAQKAAGHHDTIYEDARRHRAVLIYEDALGYLPCVLVVLECYQFGHNERQLSRICCCRLTPTVVSVLTGPFAHTSAASAVMSSVVSANTAPKTAAAASASCRRDGKMSRPYHQAEAPGPSCADSSRAAFPGPNSGP